MAGNVDAARERWAHAVHNPDYRAFLDFMCPPQQGSSFTGTTTGPGSGQGPGATLRGSGPLSGAAAAAQRLGGWRGEPGRFPPVGTDPTSCPRPIFGVWDDHDYGWNNGNRRLPNKAEYKRMYLDAVGEAPGSSRRGADAGMQAVYSLSGGGPGLGVDLVLLDERWYRDPLPCELRRDWCTGVLAQPELFPRHTGFCRDFLLDDGASGRGSCCTKDGDLAAWCALPDSRSSPLWASACDPTSAQWGSGTLVLGADNRTLMGAGDALWDTEPGPLWSRLMQAHDSPVCEVLGAAQRRWLRERLASSSAALTLVASGSVPVGNPVFNDSKGLCSDDDWTCYRPAQVNLLHTVANVSSGCVVILTGDFHYGDIKLITPGPGTPYAGTLQTGRLRKPIYQIMASGMTDSTAKHDGAPCAGSFREDLLGLRPLGRCSYMDGPNFGMVEVDWEAQVAHLTLRDASSGAVAVGLDGKEQHLALSLKTCLPV
ncbi:hypothetical protein HYH03_014440 [Edaphochlamys debaryana]|uniref:PhoD-like phosphatase metallophosphatase domain-containing protein n=1 Tax=Edaphochlamys debaryana TaxID=47281 RepID=A0A836BRZ6_9CHLO|nr:hypothetical protein HYH03_014440 [Edaphochlamys debaryana]|eukprot:KAG2486941.1 hypothetical protein HYH03_014440 [Edaphochlamys debaryana]